MWQIVANHRLAWLAVGIVIGLFLGGLWPHTPLHAVATDRYDTFCICTGPVDDEFEAIYFLDFLTGDLRAAVVSPKNNKFSAFYQLNILTHLNVDVSKNPRYLMVTGISDLRRGAARARFSRALVYVAEVTTGRVAAYAIPWQKDLFVAGQPIRESLIPLDVTQFRTAAIRDAGAPQ